MSKFHFVILVVLLIGLPRPGVAQQENPILPSPINPMAKVSQWPPPRTKKNVSGAVKRAPAAKIKRPPSAGTGASAADASKKLAAAPPQKPQAVILIGLSDREIRSWLKILLPRAEKGSWLKRFKQEHNRRPMIKVSPVMNRTSQHLNSAMVHRVARSLISSSGQLELASKSKAADFLLLGYVVAMEQSAGQTRLISTMLALSLIHVTTGQKVWTDLLRIRKLVTLKKNGPHVRRLAPRESIDLAGGFNDDDALQAMRGLRQNLRRSPWLKRPRPKVVRLSPLRNRTSERIQERFITLVIERALTRTPHVRLLGRRGEMDQVRAERSRQILDGFTPPDDQELNTTHLLTGYILSEISRLPSSTLYQYLVTMQSINVETNQKTWMAVAKVKKRVESRP